MKSCGTLAKNYEWIGYAQISNSFILLMVLNENKARKKASTAGEISEIIAQKSKGRLYKVPSTLRDALEYRLKREGLVEDEKSIANKSFIMEKAGLLSYYCDLFYLLSIFFLMGIIINASIDLSIPTNTKETPAPNKIPPNTSSG